MTQSPPRGQLYLLRSAVACSALALVLIPRQDIRDLLDYLCSIAEQQEIFYLWRPTLRDPNDDMVLEVAVAATADAIVTHNVRDFGAAGTFEVAVLRPQEFLASLGGSS